MEQKTIETLFNVAAIGIFVGYIGYKCIQVWRRGLPMDLWEFRNLQKDSLKKPPEKKGEIIHFPVKKRPTRKKPLRKNAPIIHLKKPPTKPPL